MLAQRPASETCTKNRTPEVCVSIPGAGMTDAQMESFIWDLAKLGFCWQFITLAGFHCDALNIDLFAREPSRGLFAAACGFLFLFFWGGVSQGEFLGGAFLFVGCFSTRRVGLH